MHRIALVTLALAGLGSTFAVTPAHADAPETNGLLCRFTSVVNRTVVSGGPVLLFSPNANPTLPGTRPEAGTLTCKVTIDTAWTSDHTLDGQKVSGHSDTGLFTAGPAPINNVASTDTNVFLCSEFTDDSDGVTYYWDDDNGGWSTSPLVPCAPAHDEFIDSIVCPILALAFPPEGDVVLPVVGAVWDCPPYGDI